MVMRSQDLRCCVRDQRGYVRWRLDVGGVDLESCLQYLSCLLSVAE